MNNNWGKGGKLNETNDKRNSVMIVSVMCDVGHASKCKRQCGWWFD